MIEPGSTGSDHHLHAGTRSHMERVMVRREDPVVNDTIEQRGELLRGILTIAALVVEES